MTKNKTVKTLLFTLMMTFIAVGTIAIAKEVMKNEEPVKVAKSLVFETWVFTGTDPTNPSHYQRDNPANPAPCPLDLETICKISAPADVTNTEPVMSAIVTGTTTVADQIEEALNSLTDLEEGPKTNLTVLGFKRLN